MRGNGRSFSPQCEYKKIHDYFSMEKEDLVDLIHNLMNLKHYGNHFFSEEITLKVWKGNTTVDKDFHITLKQRNGIPRNSKYFKEINKVFDAFGIDFINEDDTISFSLEDVKCDKTVY